MTSCYHDFGMRHFRDSQMGLPGDTRILFEPSKPTGENYMISRAFKVSSIAAAALLAACGGGGLCKPNAYANATR